MILRILAVLLMFFSMLTGCGNTKVDNPTVLTEITTETYEENMMKEYDFSEFKNVELLNTDINSMNDEQLAVLYVQAKYCQAMTDADTDTMRELVSEDMVFTHMSGRQQSVDEYLADVNSGRLTYYTIGIDSPEITVSDDTATITYTSVLNANAYGAKGTFRMTGTHYYEKRNGTWIAVNRK